MHKTRNDIAANARKSVSALLNARVADVIDLQRALKYAHWNVKGPQFVALHELFDEMTETYDAHVDDMAERVTALGGTAIGTVQDVAKMTSLEPMPGDVFDGLKLVEALATRTATVAKSVRKGIDEAEEAGDADAADILTALSRQLDKNLWFLEAHLQKG